MVQAQPCCRQDPSGHAVESQCLAGPSCGSYSQSHSPDVGRGSFSVFAIHSRATVGRQEAPRPPIPLTLETAPFTEHLQRRQLSRLLQNSPPLGTYKTLPCVFNPYLTRHESRPSYTPKHAPTQPEMLRQLNHVCLCSAKLLVLPHDSEHLQIPTCLFTCSFSSCLCIATYSITFRVGFFCWDCSGSVAIADILRHLTTSSGQDVLLQEPGQRSPREDITILLHLPYEKQPTGAHKQANPYSIPLLADLATGIKKVQIMESKKRLQKPKLWW